MPSRYSAVWSNGTVKVLDSLNNNASVATVQFTRTIDGDGWKVFRFDHGKGSRKVHPTPEKAIASIMLMIHSKAKTDLAKSEQGPEGDKAREMRKL